MFVDGYCPGCGGGEGNQSCKIAKCSLEPGGILYCFQCEKFPCGYYEKADEYDSFITHRNRRVDLEKAKSVGIEAYNREQAEKIEILTFLLKYFNDGRKKSFFCLAVNLLELQDLNFILHKLKDDTEFEQMSLEERAENARRLLQSAADKENISLKLNKKSNGKTKSRSV